MDRRKNIVLIVAESMDGRKMGCMGDPAMAAATPNLDRLAAGGTLFPRAYSTCPVCNPARASLWSGRYPHVHGCWNNFEGLRPEVPTFRDRLEEAGYAFLNLGKTDYEYGQHSIRDRVGAWTRAAGIHRPLSRTPLPQTVDDDAPLYRQDRDNIHRAVEWVKEAGAGDAPFMLLLSTGLVHPAFRVQARYKALIEEAALAFPPPDPSDHPVVRYQRATKNAPPSCPEALVREIRLTYAAMIATLDDLLVPLLDLLRTPNLRDSTYVVFTSDHGEMAMEHGQILKRTMYEPSMHVPLMIRGPGITPGRRVDSTVSWIDLHPTLLDMAGLAPTADLDGTSLLPASTGRGDPGRGWAFGEYHGDRCNTGSFMLVQGDWKLVSYAGFDPLLFNLRADPWEVENRARTEPERLAAMQTLLNGAVDTQAVDTRAKTSDREQFRAWRREQLALGTYRMEMARIYSGFDYLAIEDIHPWTDEDEARICAWLADPDGERS